MQWQASISWLRARPPNTRRQSVGSSIDRRSANACRGRRANGCSRITIGVDRCTSWMRSSTAVSQCPRRGATGARARCAIELTTIVDGSQTGVGGARVNETDSRSMNISIFGLGYVGAVSLACLARDGHQVIGVDIDEAKLELITAGKTPVVEEGMVDLVATVAASGRVRATMDVKAAVLGSELSLICVGTPSAPNGSQDLSAILKLARDIGGAMKEKSDPHVFVFRSTVAPGTVDDAIRPIVERESGKKAGEP